MSPAPAKIVNRYLDALTSSDLDGAASVLADDFTFLGPMGFVISGRDAFLAQTAGKYDHARGYTMLRQWADEHDVCSIYELAVETTASATSILMAEWSTVHDGRLTSSRLVFDTSVGATLGAA
jgi:hypothetical protein